MMPLDCQ